jgi:RimJ/RimL family protein N-acetyltransferase
MGGLGRRAHHTPFDYINRTPHHDNDQSDDAPRSPRSPRRRTSIDTSGCHLARPRCQPHIEEQADMSCIHTERLVLRPAILADIDALLPLFNTWDVIRWLAVAPWPYGHADMDIFIRTKIDYGDKGPEKFRVITREGTAIGGVAINSAKTREFGYWLGRPYWGQGIMTEAAVALTRNYFASSARRPLTSGVFDGNAASLKVQENVGFVVTARKPEFCRPQNRDLPLIETTLSRGRFVALHGNGKV